MANCVICHLKIIFELSTCNKLNMLNILNSYTRRILSTIHIIPLINNLMQIKEAVLHFIFKENFSILKDYRKNYTYYTWMGIRNISQGEITGGKLSSFKITIPFTLKLPVPTFMFFEKNWTNQILYIFQQHKKNISQKMSQLENYFYCIKKHSLVSTFSPYWQIGINLNLWLLWPTFLT